MNYTNPTIAQLRKAAPEMYEALKEIMNQSKYWQGEAEHIIETSEALKKAVEALSKAEGKEV